MGKNDFEFQVGSTVTVLTTVGISTGTGTLLGTALGTNTTSPGVFTGTILDEAEFSVKRKPGSSDSEDAFLVLSLTAAAAPFVAGQIVWIRVDQIVAFALADCEG